MHYLGIDISKNQSYIAHYEDQKLINEFLFTHTKQSFQKLKVYVSSLDNTIIIYESTGVYSRPIYDFCTDNRFKFYELNPLEANFKMKSLRANKTDKADAHKLVLLGANLPSLTSKHQNRELYDELKEYARFYLELEKQENILKVQLLETMHQTFPFFEKLFKNRYSTISLNLAHIFPHASMVSDLTKKEITEVISNASLKGMSAIKIENYGDNLIQLANESFPCVSKDHFLVKKVRFVAKSLLHLQEERKHYNQEMINLARQLPEFEILLSIPGFGRLTTALFIGELGDIRRFSSHKKLNAYVGIDIRRYQSGQSHYRDTINRRGNKKARKLLYLIVLNIIRGQSRFRNHINDYYYKLKSQPYGKPHKTAIVACINKLLKTIHYLIMNNCTYDYEMSPH